MSLHSTAARNASLAMSYGADRHSTLSLATFEVPLFAGDPRIDGVELDAAGGYVAPEVDNDGTTWPDAPADGQTISAPVGFPDSTGPWTVDGTLAVATHWATRDPDTGDLWDVMPLPGDGLLVDGSGVTGISIQLIVNYTDQETP